MLEKLKSRSIFSLQGVADRIFAATADAYWDSPPRFVCDRIVAQLGLAEAGIGELNGEAVVNLRTRQGHQFAGPDQEERWNCSPRKIQMMRELVARSSSREKLTLADGHYALIHNLIVRYTTEFSAYPYRSFRTQNLIAGDTFLDIGAFRGYVAVKASFKVGALGRVYAIEPIQDNFAFVDFHKAVNRLDNLRCLQCAITDDYSEKVDFFVTRNQQNAAVPDHLSGQKTQLSVQNVSTASLAATINKDRPSRVIVSITTNGTEMAIAMTLMEHLIEAGTEYLEITIPTIFSRAQIPDFLQSIRGGSIHHEEVYPWLKLIYSRK